MKVCVVILNWNRKDDTADCIKSLLACKNTSFNLQIVVVDNGSTDGSESELKKLNTNGISYEVIPTGKNLGYAAGNNVGIRHALNHGADYVLVLNNDTIVHPDLVSELLSASQRHPRAGILVPKIFFAPGFEFHKNVYSKSQKGKVIWFAGGRIDWKNIYGENIGVDKVDKGQFDHEEVVDFATGAAMFIKADALKKVGMFDERYFMYLEDADLSVRMKISNYGVVYVPTAVVWHKVAQSSKIGSDLNDYYIHRNRLLFGMKYANIRAKVALLRESIRFLQTGRKWQRQGVLDFYLMRFGKGSWK